MHVDPHISALRGDHAAQRAMREEVGSVIDECRGDPAMASGLSALEAYGAGEPLENCPALQEVFSAGRAARSFIEPFVASLVGLHRANPLAQLAFRHQSKGGFHFIQIAGKGSATLGLALHDETAACTAGGVASFPAAERHEAVLAGEARIGLLQIESESSGHAQITEKISRVTDGDVFSFGGRDQSRIVRAVRGRLLVLRLARTPPCPGPTRQFALPSGRLVHRASGDRRESRHEMMLAVLGRMGRSDAAPVAADMSARGSDHLRWQALRECLALDTGEGFRALANIAAEPADPLAENAALLRAQLLETYPQLARIENAPCPA